MKPTLDGEPKPNCRKCHGRGHLGKNLNTRSFVVCGCVEEKKPLRVKLPAPNFKPAPGAFGSGKRTRVARQAFLAASQTEANVLAKVRADRRTYTAWMATLSESNQAFARAHGLDRPMPDDSGFFRPQSEDALQIAESEPIPESITRGTRNDRPIVAQVHPILDAIEPEDTAVDVENLTPDQIRAASEDFEHALRWALSADPKSRGDHHLVALGKRSAALIACLRADLAAGLPIEHHLAREFLASYGDFRLSETIARLQATGDIYARFLEWMRRGGSLSALGERLQLVAYELRPDLIDAETLAGLGEATGKTRQAKSKGTNCLRDTFAGLRGLCMRADITRIRCMLAQLGRPVTAAFA